MDEAERCHRLAYIAYGKLLANGSVEDVVKTGGLTTWRVTGRDLPKLAETLRPLPGVKQVVAFGAVLHVSGRNSEQLRASITPWMNANFQWQLIDASLEDVFISLMDTAKDNFS
jgi:ABC-2 type transport system ATP-binding protein